MRQELLQPDTDPEIEHLKQLSFEMYLSDTDKLAQRLRLRASGRGNRLDPSRALWEALETASQELAHD